MSTEQFWCPEHGRIDAVYGQTLIYDEQGSGPYIPYYKVKCRICGQQGHFVCDGETSACRLAIVDVRSTSRTVCLFHRCHIYGHPFPGGVALVTAQLEELDKAQRNPFSDLGISMDPQ